MSNAPFDRVPIHVRERPVNEDINRNISQIDRSLRFFAQELLSDENTGAARDGFIKQGLRVLQNSPVGLSIRVKAGLGFQVQTDSLSTAVGAIEGLTEFSTYKPIVLLNDVVFTVPTAPTAPNNRTDIVEIKADFFLAEPNERQVLNEFSGVFEPNTINKIFSYLIDTRIGTINAPALSTMPLSYKVGVAGNPGVVPETTNGYIKIAEIFVGSDVTEIVTANITDFRPLVVEEKVNVSGDTMTGPLDISTTSDQNDRHLDIISSIEQTKAFVAVETSEHVGWTVGRFGGPMMGSPCVDHRQLMFAQNPSGEIDYWVEVSTGAAAYDKSQSPSQDGNIGQSGPLMTSALIGDIGALRMNEEVINKDEIVAAMEFSVAILGIGGEAVFSYWGWHDSASNMASDIDDQGMFFRYNHAGDAFQFRSSDGAGPVITALPSPTDENFHLYRIEWLGGNVSGGPRQRAYIDNVLTATNSVDITPTAMFPMLACRAAVNVPSLATRIIINHFRMFLPLGSIGLLSMIKP